MLKFYQDYIDEQFVFHLIIRSQKYLRNNVLMYLIRIQLIFLLPVEKA